MAISCKNANYYKKSRGEKCSGCGLRNPEDADDFTVTPILGDASSNPGALQRVGGGE
jgi:hypothetical protein